MDLLDDLDDLADNEEDLSIHGESEVSDRRDKGMAMDAAHVALDDDSDDMAVDGIEDDDNENGEDEEMPDLTGIRSIQLVAHLTASKRLKEVMAKIDQFMASNRVRVQAENTGPVEEDPEYKLLVNANNLMFDVDTEILLVHKFIRDKYATRFPELETLVPNAIDFARAVKAIGNETDLMKLDLKALLPSSLVMIITVTATATNGKPLSDEQLKIVFEACDMALELDNVKRTILEYVESRMTFLAPNLTAILGSTSAAKLMGAAGGLTALSKIPACNLQVMGKAGKTDTGLFAKGQQKHAGFIYYSDLVQVVPKEYRSKATRMIAAKCCLAARMDRAREAVDGNLGRIWRDEIVKKLEKAQEPPPGKGVKALPIPNDGPKKRRGGKRFRRMKEKMAVTEAWKAQNRMKFNEAQEEIIVGDTVKELGLLGGQTGKLRLNAPDASKKLGVAKKYRSITGSGGSTSGLSSSLAFTPIQGIELENPEAAAQRKSAMKDDKYFGGFKKPPAK